ncbi:sodium/proton antiporter, CPA1 family [Nocardioides scoriae]|uniref:Sodium/proton antiporter, CPA1 family n=1 Tax=Nocardioides scoriae TaxID=642780 RepID=A0A1H1TR05_9ACTN|nr:cation:proton antiporter [Nocardioides scoriae]SDS62647.1 sodium/proton antiporter, CPA1 family [Nocardioides scoriae]
MHTVVLLVGIVAVVVAVAGVSSKLDLPSPLVLILVGVAGSYLPFVPDVTLEPEVVLFALLPPLLYAAALQTSLVDFNANRRPILLLSVVLVIVTTLGVGVVVHALLPQIGWAASFAIGAVVAPPDAVAATSIGRRIGLPRRIVTILEGESLLNDATALVALNTAIAAIVSWRVVGTDFAIAAVGGVAVGLAFYVVVGFVRKHVVQTTIDSALGFITPFAAYVAAEEIGIPTSGDHVAHPSGVVAVVVAGLLLGHNSPRLQTAQSRIAMRLNWSSIQFILESAVFLLIGLQARTIIADAFSGEASVGRVIGVCVAVLAAVVVLRIAWVFLARYLLVRPKDGVTGQPTPWAYSFLLGWAGMRGVVTLAAAFVIPPETPYRDVLLLVAFFVTASTLFVQGLSLPWFARRLRVPSPDAGADALARANLLHQASQAGLARLEQIEEDDPHDVGETIRDRVRRRDFAAWERVGPNQDENPSETYNRWRRSMIDAERSRVLEVRSTGQVPHEVVDEVLAMLDVEESMLEFSDAERNRVRAANTAHLLEGGCEHLRQVRPPVEPDTPGECGDCLREGTAWVHLRMCVVCGHVACCDSSPQRHASVHHEHTGHEVMRSAEPGEEWRWCFVDELTG